MHINLHTVPLVRRTAASLVGALIALTVHSVYQDTTAALLSHQRHADRIHQAAESREAMVKQNAMEVAEYARMLKRQREQEQE